MKWANSITTYGVTTWVLPVRGEAALRWARAAGFCLVHLDCRDILGSSPQSIVETAASVGVTLEGLAVEQLEVIGYDNMGLAKSAVGTAIEVAMELGVNFIYLPAFGAAEIADAAGLVAIQTLLEYALELTEGTETVIASEMTLVAADIRRLFNTINHPRLRLLFDTQNPFLRGHNPTMVAMELADLIGPFVHVKDGWASMGTARIGKGISNVGDTLTALHRAGFRGTYVIENDYRYANHQIARLDQTLLDELLNKLPQH